MQAQAGDGKVSISSSIGASVADGGPAPALGVTFGYRPMEPFGFELELSYLLSMDFGEFDGPRILALGLFRPTIYPPLEFDVTGRAVMFGANVVGYLPVGGSRLRPYVVAGGGVADVERRVEQREGCVCPAGSYRGPGFSETALALSAGGGLDLQAWRAVAVGVDARYTHLFTDADAIDLARISGRVTWRF